AAVEAAGRLLEGLGHHLTPGAPTVDADVVADAVAVLHTVSNAQLHELARQHLGRAPREDEFEPSTWVMIREGFTTTGLAYANAIADVHA
ncbi:amidase, partial [Mycobacterium kansasii]